MHRSADDRPGPPATGAASVSIVIPAHNEQALLGATLDSVASAIHELSTDAEIIVVDDASTDRTASIARDHGARVVRVELRHIAAVRNAGAHHARGDTLVFLDADTLLPAATLRGALDAIQRGAVGGGARVTLEGDNPRLLGTLTGLFEWVYFCVFRYAAGCFVFARRDVFQAVGGFDERHYAGEEVHLSRALKRRGRFEIIGSPVVSSGRKLRTYTGREVFVQLIRIAVRGPMGTRKRSHLGLWYDARREPSIMEESLRERLSKSPNGACMSISHQHAQSRDPVRVEVPTNTDELRVLTEVTSIPTASGLEHGVIDYIQRWVAQRPSLKMTLDNSGNLHIAPSNNTEPSGSPIVIQAHLDHPNFVVERVVAPGTLELAFRGGVMIDYFRESRVRVLTRSGAHLLGTVTQSLEESPGPFGLHILELDDDQPASDDARPGDTAVWDLAPSEIDADGVLHAPACDNLASVAAALCAMDRLLARLDAGERCEDVRLLFTLAEEIGFIGAIGACKEGSLPRDARVITLENSRAFADVPIGGGPIIRVGDRVSVFSPTLTANCAARAEEIFGGPALPHATQRTDHDQRPWQRKLMPGGACEASVFATYGYQATCVCLPLGNYHNMAMLAEVQSGEYDADTLGPPPIQREFIHTADYASMVDLLEAIGESLPESDPFQKRLETLYDSHSFVLDEARTRSENKND